MLGLPNELVGEIIEACELSMARLGDVKTLQRLRLVNRSFNRSATSVLFHNFDTLCLGKSLENTKSWVDGICTASGSPLLKKVRNLSVPPWSMWPGKWGYFSEQQVQSFEEQFLDLIKRLIDALGSGFKFQGVILGRRPSNPAILETTRKLGRSFERQLYTGTAEMISALIMQHDAFSDVARFEGIFLNLGLNNKFLRPFGWGSGTESGLLAPNALAEIKELDIYFISYSRSDAAAVGSVLSKESKLSSFTVRFRSASLHPFMASDGVPRSALESLSLIASNWLYIPEYAALTMPLAQSPNLTTLRLIGPTMDEDSLWSYFFRELHSSLDLPNLASVFFSRLGYHNQAFYEVDRDEIYDPTCAQTYTRPLLTNLDEDIDEFLALRAMMENRREKRGLEKDTWLSIFCKQEGVIATRSGPEGINIESDYNVQSD